MRRPRYIHVACFEALMSRDNRPAACWIDGFFVFDCYRRVDGGGCGQRTFAVHPLGALSARPEQSQRNRGAILCKR